MWPCLWLTLSHEERGPGGEVQGSRDAPGSPLMTHLRQPVYLREATGDATEAGRIWVGEEARAGEAAAQRTGSGLGQFGRCHPVYQTSVEGEVMGNRQRPLVASHQVRPGSVIDTRALVLRQPEQRGGQIIGDGGGVELVADDAHPPPGA